MINNLNCVDPNVNMKSDTKQFEDSGNCNYVLVTPVRNEEAHIGTTIRSVINQTVQPLEWVIVSDGSTDKTNSIVKEASRQHSWITLIELPERKKASFASVVHNTTLGIQKLKERDYSYLGLLDSDLRFQNNYFQNLMEEFVKCPRLGLAGGVAIDIGKPKDVLPINRIDVPGALQFFRRECFESLGGLIAVPEGGWDGLSCAVARMKGFETKLVTSLIVDHLKPRNITQGGKFRRIWQMGTRDYAIGYHPMFELAKCVRHIRTKPYIIFGLVWWLGFCSCYLSGKKRVVPVEVIGHVRREQIIRLKRMIGIARQP